MDYTVSATATAELLNVFFDSFPWIKPLLPWLFIPMVLGGLTEMIGMVRVAAGDRAPEAEPIPKKDEYEPPRTTPHFFYANLCLAAMVLLIVGGLAYGIHQLNS